MSMPFLYPCLFASNLSSGLATARTCIRRSRHRYHALLPLCRTRRHASDLSSVNEARRAVAYEPLPPTDSNPRATRLNPPPEDYSRTPFTDKCTLSVHAGSGGNGCVSFFRDVHIPDGPPNGGDGGHGGNIWIQAVAGQTSLHKLARRGIVKAGRGIGGQGKSQNGRKGEDVCVIVPVGTVVREIWRSDPVAEEEAKWAEIRGSSLAGQDAAPDVTRPSSPWMRNRWIVYPGVQGNQMIGVNESLPPMPKPRRSQFSVLEPGAPIVLDLDKPMDKPMLLAAGAAGGLGNPHFATKGLPKPKFASKGELGVRIKLELELKLLADVALVGLPNAGKSTLLRAISNSRTRIGDWAFTTLEPTIGTVVLDTNIGRPIVRSGIQGQPPRQNFTVADIPGLIEDAHLDKGLGLGFLRHVERARILAFVIDLSAGDAVVALQNLWKEVGEYENLRNRELAAETESRMVDWNAFDSKVTPDARNVQHSPILDEDGAEMMVFPEPAKTLEPIKLPPMSAKPWFVVATKADKGDTQEEFTKLQAYIEAVQSGAVRHPGGMQNGWKTKIAAIPVSAINDQGTSKIAEWTAGLLDSLHGAGMAGTPRVIDRSSHQSLE